MCIYARQLAGLAVRVYICVPAGMFGCTCVLTVSGDRTGCTCGYMCQVTGLAARVDICVSAGRTDRAGTGKLDAEVPSIGCGAAHLHYLRAEKDCPEGRASPGPCSGLHGIHLCPRVAVWLCRLPLQRPQNPLPGQSKR